MKILHYLPIAAIAFSAVSCGDTAKKEVVKYDINNLDTTAVIGDNFYQYATGGWAKNNPLKDEFARYGSFDQLRERNQEQVRDIIVEIGKTAHKEGEVGQKIGDLYAIGMDSVKLNADGIAPILPELTAIKEAQSQDDIIKLVGELRQYASSPFFTFGVSTDQKNSNENIVIFYQGGLSLGNRDYYLNTDSSSLALREGYKNLIKTQFASVKDDFGGDVDKIADAIVKIETELAKAHFSNVERRIAEKNYNKINSTDLSKTIGDLNWELFFQAAGTKGKAFDDVNIGQIAAVSKAVELIKTLPIDEVKCYLAWKVIDSAASYLSDDFAEANFDFYGKQLTGKQEMQPRWKTVVSNVDGALSEAVGQIYVQKYFPAEAKERMVNLVKNLQVTLGERINNLTWMSDETKAKAQEKLNTFHVKIGYPDKWKDYSTLKIEKDSYWANMKRAQLFSYNEMMDKIGQPVDKEEWHMPPQMVNAYYSPVTNEICFPAGILQAPFFYLDGDDAVNYGGIGVVIGHEMSHGFDDQGSKYDKDGNMSDWWTADDRKAFDERAQVLVDHFNTIEVLPGLMANGKFTLGENIGDFGGIQIAYNAFEKTEQAKQGEKMEGFTPEQRFFLSYATLWAGHVRDAEIRRLTQIDPHSLGKWRVDGTLPHIDAWYKAFDIKEDAKMYIPKEKRADIW